MGRPSRVAVSRENDAAQLQSMASPPAAAAEHGVSAAADHTATPSSAAEHAARAEKPDDAVLPAAVSTLLQSSLRGLK